MGWLHTYDLTKEKAIENLTDVSQWNKPNVKVTLLKKAVVGNHLWTAWQQERTDTGEVIQYINLDLLSNKKGYGYGWKSLTESAGPYYYTIPLSFFKVVDDDNKTANKSWREDVRKFKARKKLLSNLKSGDDVTTYTGKYTIQKLKGTKGIIGMSNTGKLWRLQPESIETINGDKI